MSRPFDSKYRTDQQRQSHWHPIKKSNHQSSDDRARRLETQSLDTLSELCQQQRDESFIPSHTVSRYLMLFHTGSRCLILSHAVSHCLILSHTVSRCLTLSHAVSFRITLSQTAIKARAGGVVILHHSYCVIWFERIFLKHRCRDPWSNQHSLWRKTQMTTF